MFAGQVDQGVAQHCRREGVELPPARAALRFIALQVRDQATKDIVQDVVGLGIKRDVRKIDAEQLVGQRPEPLGDVRKHSIPRDRIAGPEAIQEIPDLVVIHQLIVHLSDPRKTTRTIEGRPRRLPYPGRRSPISQLTPFVVRPPFEHKSFQ